ncbi:MAG: hypothetical protein ACI91F_000343 [Candidatus Binatia bacterium]
MIGSDFNSCPPSGGSVKKFTRILAVSGLGLILASCGNSGAPPVEVVISLSQDTARLASATILVDYSQAGATISRDGSDLECAFISPFVGGDFTDDGVGRLTLRARSNRGFTGPIDLAACRMIPADPMTNATTIQKAMKARIVKAQDEEGKELDPRSPRQARIQPLPVPAPVETDKKPTPPAAVSDKQKVSPDGKKPAGSNPPPSPAPTPASKPAPAPKAPTASVPKATPPAVPAAPVAPVEPASTSAQRVRDRIAANNPLGNKAGPSAPAAADDGQAETGTATDNYDDSPGFSPGLPEYEITVSIVEGSNELGALQFEIDHLGDSGGFVSQGATKLDCLFLGGMLGAANKLGRSAKIGIIDLDGMPETGPVVTCAFRTNESLSPGSFNVRVMDAADTETEQVSPLPVLAVTNVVSR